MPEQRPAPDAPGRAVEATIERIKEELGAFGDPESLNRIRAEFRKQIPLRLRSYAAALLILEASNGRQDSRKARKDGAKNREDDRKKSSTQRQPKGERRVEEVKKDESRRDDGRREEAKRRERPEGQALPSEEQRPRFHGEGVTVFFGMGKRQRLYPRVLLRILTEEGGLANEEIGDIRSFDNYSFADIDPARAEALIASLDGTAFRGRGIPVSKARKRGAAPEEGSEIPQEGEGRIEDIETVDEASDLLDAESIEAFDDGDELREDFADLDEGLPEVNDEDAEDLLDAEDEGLDKK